MWDNSSILWSLSLSPSIPKFGNFYPSAWERERRKRDSMAVKMGTESLGMSRLEYPGWNIQVGILWSRKSRRI